MFNKVIREQVVHDTVILVSVGCGRAGGRASGRTGRGGSSCNSENVAGEQLGDIAPGTCSRAPALSPPPLLLLRCFRMASCWCGGEIGAGRVACWQAPLHAVACASAASLAPAGQAAPLHEHLVHRLSLRAQAAAFRNSFNCGSLGDSADRCGSQPRHPAAVKARRPPSLYCAGRALRSSAPCVLWSTRSGTRPATPWSSSTWKISVSSGPALGVLLLLVAIACTRVARCRHCLPANALWLLACLLQRATSTVRMQAGYPPSCGTARLSMLSGEGPGSWREGWWVANNCPRLPPAVQPPCLDC